MYDWKLRRLRSTQGVCSKPGSMRSGRVTDQLERAACALSTRKRCFRHSGNGVSGAVGRVMAPTQSSNCLSSGWFGYRYCQTAFRLSVLNIDNANHNPKGFFYKNLKNTFSVSLINQCHLVLCISIMNSVVIASFQFLPISYSLLCIDKRF